MLTKWLLFTLDPALPLQAQCPLSSSKPCPFFLGYYNEHRSGLSAPWSSPPCSHSLLCYLNGDVSDEVSPQVELSQTSSAVYHCLPPTPSSCSLTRSCPFFTWVFTSQDSADWDASPAGQVSLCRLVLWQSPSQLVASIAWLVLGPTQLIGPGRHFRSAKPAGTGWQGGVRTEHT